MNLQISLLTMSFLCKGDPQEGRRLHQEASRSEHAGRPDRGDPQQQIGVRLRSDFTENNPS